MQTDHEDKSQLTRLITEHVRRATPENAERIPLIERLGILFSVGLAVTILLYAVR